MESLRIKGGSEKRRDRPSADVPNDNDNDNNNEPQRLEQQRARVVSLLNKPAQPVLLSRVLLLAQARDTILEYKHNSILKIRNKMGV